MAEKLAKGDKLTITNARQIDKAEAGVSGKSGKPCALSYTVAENLLLRVQPSGSRSWVFRYQSHGKVKELGLGKAASNPKGAELGLVPA